MKNLSEFELVAISGGDDWWRRIGDVSKEESDRPSRETKIETTSPSGSMNTTVTCITVVNVPVTCRVSVGATWSSGQTTTTTTSRGR